jgi:predicted transcriptional regulator
MNGPSAPLWRLARLFRIACVKVKQVAKVPNEGDLLGFGPVARGKIGSLRRIERAQEVGLGCETRG